MAFLLNKADDRIKVVSRYDSALAVDDIENDDFKELYKKYLETLDESLLTFKNDECPTRFVLKRVLNWSESYKLKADHLRVNKEGQASVNLGTQLDEVRMSLLDIENPPGVEGCLVFKSDGSGGASKDLMEKLIASDMVDDLYYALSQNKKGARSINKKK